MTDQAETEPTTDAAGYDDDAPVLSDIDPEAGFDDVEGGPDAQEQGENTAALDQDGFYDMFRGVVGLPNVMMELRGEQPLRALEISYEDQRARKASDALYETIAAVPALHWLLMPDSIWFKRAFVIGSFVVPTALAARREYAGRLAAQAAAEGDEAHQGETMQPGPDVPAPTNVVVAIPEA